MKITDFFSSSPSSSNKAERTFIIDSTEQEGQIMSHSGKICTTVQTPKKRRLRFTDPEIHILVDTILAHIEQLFGHKSLNASGKAAVWDSVVKKVNEVGVLKRTVIECKKRWSDYKRKVKQCIDRVKMQSYLSGKVESIEANLSKRQVKVAMFFKMDAEGTNEIQLSDDYSSDEGDGASSSQNVVIPSTNILNSEDEFIDQKEKLSLSTCSINNSPQDGSISQSYEGSQAIKQPSESIKAKSSDGSMNHKPKAAQLQLTNLDTKLDQLIVQQKNTNEILQSIHNSVTASLDLQKKMNRLLKSNFLELQNSIISTKKASSNQSSIMDITLKSLHAKLDEINSSLHAKQLQELMSSDESELNLSCTQDVASTPVKTPPARKRKFKQSPSTSLMKKNKFM
ncbi:uncharacterized protein LOC142107574 [Mixophyes fleayi]|uniref:uncharacterized protein LOC142107574 n=1 Tax=Mixophyes fleayi TaxID=3061075 RepID=UPI003F4E252C